MPIELVPVLGAGIGAGLAMYAVQLAGSAVRRPEAFDAAAFWSSVLRLGGRDPRIAGFFVHLLVSIGVAAGLRPWLSARRNHRRRMGMGARRRNHSLGRSRGLRFGRPARRIRGLTRRVRARLGAEWRLRLPRCTPLLRS